MIDYKILLPIVIIILIVVGIIFFAYKEISTLKKHIKQINDNIQNNNSQIYTSVNECVNKIERISKTHISELQNINKLNAQYINTVNTVFHDSEESEGLSKNYVSPNNQDEHIATYHNEPNKNVCNDNVCENHNMIQNNKQTNDDKELYMSNDDSVKIPTYNPQQHGNIKTLPNYLNENYNKDDENEFNENEFDENEFDENDDVIEYDSEIKNTVENNDDNKNNKCNNEQIEHPIPIIPMYGKNILNNVLSSICEKNIDLMFDLYNVNNTKNNSQPIIERLETPTHCDNLSNQQTKTQLCKITPQNDIINDIINDTKDVINSNKDNISNCSLKSFKSNKSCKSSCSSKSEPILSKKISPNEDILSNNSNHSNNSNNSNQSNNSNKIILKSIDEYTYSELKQLAKKNNIPTSIKNEGKMRQYKKAELFEILSKIE